jgi:glycosyltransferase involved in cell wall biosynthesis
VSLPLSVVLITLNEEQNLGRTLASVQPLVADGAGEIIVVDSGSTDRTVEIAKSFGAKVFVEEWKGFAAQKNSAIEKAIGEWILSLDADEEMTEELRKGVALSLKFVQRGELPDADGDWLHNWVGFGDPAEATVGFRIWRRNFFLGRPLRWGGFDPDPKLRLVRRELARFELRPVHEDMICPPGSIAEIWTPLLHHAYPRLEIYLEHMRRYADLGAELVKDKPRWWLWLNRWFNPPLTFFYNYVVRMGFLDGREGFLLHWNHRRYVGWKYAKALELSSSPRSRGDAERD